MGEVDQQDTGERGESGDPGAPSPSRLAVSLHGELPCVQCGYELRGVSILGVCPECGTAVRATLLAVVDPLAAELRPISRPRATGLGLLVWVGGFCCAGLLVMVELVRQVLGAWQLGVRTPMSPWQGYVIAVLVVISGAGAALLTRPHDQVARRETVLAWVGVLLHLPMGVIAFVLCDLQVAAAGGTSGGWGGVVWEPAPQRTLWRIGAGLTGLGIIVCLRPVARLLVARSLALRTGRVDRQTMLATGAAIAVVMLGDTLGLWARSMGRAGGTAEMLHLLAVTLIGFGAILLCLGLLSSLVDAVRIARAVVRPGPSLKQVLGEGGAP